MKLTAFKVSVLYLYMLLVCGQASTAPVIINKIGESGFNSTEIGEADKNTNYTSDGFILNRTMSITLEYYDITPESTTQHSSTDYYNMTSTYYPTSTVQPAIMPMTLISSYSIPTTATTPVPRTTTTMSPPRTSATKTNKLSCALCVIIIVNE